ncbi:hypothetical protein ACSBR2_033086 [Camellia fascicularis]
MTGKYATPATNELGIQIRTLCPVKDVKSWLDLDETTKSAVIQAVLDKFQIGDDFHNDLQAQEIVNKKAYGLYKDWRYTLKQEFELLEGLPRDEIYAHPPLGQEMVNVQVTAIESGTPLTQEELSRQVLGQKKRFLLGFGSGTQPSTIAASRARDKDMEAMRAEVEALREE